MLTPETLAAVRDRLNAARVAVQAEPLDEQAVRASLADASDLLSEVERLRKREQLLEVGIRYLAGLCAHLGFGFYTRQGENLRDHLISLFLDGA
jgi:hypothetical protein